MAKKKLNQTDTDTCATEEMKESKRSAYYARGAELKEQSQAFSRYIGIFQKLYSSVAFWALAILVTVIVALQALDVFSMFTVAPAYGLLQMVPFAFVTVTAVMMWFAAFHAKRKSDSYYPVRGLLTGMVGSFALFLISSIAISFVTSGFGSYLASVTERIGETSLSEVFRDFGAKFSEALEYGKNLGDMTLKFDAPALKSAYVPVVEEWWDTLIVSLIFGAIIMVLLLAIRSIRILKAVSASKNSVEYGEKVGDAKIKKKQYIIYGAVSFVLAALLFLLDPLLKTMSTVTTAFKVTFSSTVNVIFGDGFAAEFAAPGSDGQVYLNLLATPLVLVALVGLLVFAVFYAYRLIKLFSLTRRVNRSAVNGEIPHVRLGAFSVISIVLSVLMLSNGITWCSSFFFSRVGGISLLTAIGKVLLIGVVILMVGFFTLKNRNEIEVCHRTQRKERGEDIEIIEKKVAKDWSGWAALAATVGCVLGWIVIQRLMLFMDSYGRLTMQILPFMGSYDMNVFGGGLMNELLYTVNKLSDKMLLIFSNINQLVLSSGVIVALTAWIISRCRFYKAGFSPDATQKLEGRSLTAPKILLYVFSAIAVILTVSQLFIEGSWAGTLGEALSSAFDMMFILVMSTFFMRKARCRKTAKILVPVAIGVVATLLYTFLFELGMPLSDMMSMQGGVGFLVSILVCTLVFQLIRWLFATTYYLETNNLIPVIFFDFMLAMMMNIAISGITGTLIGEQTVVVGPAWLFEATKALIGVLGVDAPAIGEVMSLAMPLLLNIVFFLFAMISMLAIGVILLVRNLKAEKLPGDDLCDLDHVDDEKEFLTEAEMIARQEAEAAKAE